ncbi:MAG: fibrobacter succinogenes major paralogous domain-containing protein [Betaproteobacteria bacterium]|nr:fibrobacter succinogenes major paralogous domain-containing protein [Betaproteobacteria bacterium]
MKKTAFLSFLLAFLACASVQAADAEAVETRGETATEAASPTIDAGVVINGVKWASRNVNAPGTFTATPEAAGMLYQWNRRLGWSTDGPLINSDGGAEWDKSLPSGKTWEKANDPSPAGWRVPTVDEIMSLFDIDKVTTEWATQNGVDGIKFTDNATADFIFLPMSYFRRYDQDRDRYYDNYTRYDKHIKPRSGHYWSSTPPDNGVWYNLNFDNLYLGMMSLYETHHRFDMLNIRPVAENYAQDAKAEPVRAETMRVKTRSKNPDDLVRSDQTIFAKTFGDLNGDGEEDIVMITKQTKKSAVVIDRYRGKLDRNSRGILIAFKDGEYYNTVLAIPYCFSSENEDGGVYFPPELDIGIGNGILYFHYGYGRYGYWRYTFRYQNNHFALIGFDRSNNRGGIMERAISINFLTKKKLTSTNTNAQAQLEAENNADENGAEIIEDIWEEVWQDIDIGGLLKLTDTKSCNRLDRMAEEN